MYLITIFTHLLVLFLFLSLTGDDDMAMPAAPASRLTQHHIVIFLVAVALSIPHKDGVIVVIVIPLHIGRIQAGISRRHGGR